MSARVVRLILSNDVLLGDGQERAYRRAWSLYSTDGQKLGQWDPHPDPEDARPKVASNTWFSDAELSRLMTEGE